MFVAVFVRVILAPATMPPDGSVTVPRREAVACAHAEFCAVTKKASTDRLSRRIRIFIKRFIYCSFSAPGRKAEWNWEGSEIGTQTASSADAKNAMLKLPARVLGNLSHPSLKLALP